MGPILLLHALFLSWIGQIQGSRAVTRVFVQKGKDVSLKVKTDDDLQNDAVVSWTFNANTVIVRSLPESKLTISPNYTGRIEFSVENFSMKLKNLQDADIGVYTVRVIGTQRDLVAKYNVSVQDPVSPVDLTVDSVSSSSDSCNLTVTCRTQDSLISSTFRCDTKSCSEEGGERAEVITSGAFLHVYLVNDSIICNHSNQVSWMEDIKMIEPLCLRSTDTLQKGDTTVYVVVVILISIVIIIAAALYFRRRQKNRRADIEITVNELPQVNESQRNDITTYCLVGPHTGCRGSTKSGGNTQPESLYAQVQKSARS